MGILLLLFQPKKSIGQSFIFPGIQPSTEAGLSQTNTRASSAILWNPANLIFTQTAEGKNQSSTSKDKSRVKKASKSRSLGIEGYGDFSLLSVSYTYKRSGFDPTTINVTAPPVSMGVAWRPQDKFALGIFFVPRPSSKGQEVSKLPYEQQGSEPTTVNAVQQSSSVITAVGFAFKPNKSFSLGLSIIETAEDGGFSAIPSDEDGGTPLIQMSSKGSFFQFLIGGRFAVNPLTTLGVSFKTSVVKNYTGEVSLAGGTPEPATKQGYAPSVFALGAERMMNFGQIFGEYRREGWGAGASVTKSGTPGGAESKAYKDTNIIILGGRYKFKNGNYASGSLGFYPSNVGFGSGIDASGNSNDGDLVSGVEFGDFDALDRRILAGSYRHRFSESYLVGGFNYQTGSRKVPSGYKGPGEYSMSIFTLAVGGGKSF
ncbi:MAG: hypothetical protein NT027_07740 [Proteobacteria bacterium]|nr:hypothetical protein [Pseudomonadota bacterium]